MKLNLGCGSKKLEGWINIDSVAEFKPDLVHDVSLPLPYSDDSIDEILAEGLLEHFDKYLRFIIFYDWIRILKVGGIITVVVPNFHKILRRYFKFHFSTFLDNIFGETMWETKKYLGHFGIHKWGYSVKTLTEFVQKFGMEIIKINKKDLSITLVARKRKHIKKELIYNIEINPTVDKKGFSRGSLSVKQAERLISSFLNSELSSR